MSKAGKFAPVPRLPGQMGTLRRPIVFRQRNRGGFASFRLGADNPAGAANLIQRPAFSRFVAAEPQCIGHNSTSRKHVRHTEGLNRPGTLFGLLATLLVAAALHAHPAIGIVADTAGNIFYSDNVHVWCIAPDGTLSIAVANVHTHELWLDSDGNLYGEDLWYEGERTNRWGHRVWKRSPNGNIVDIIAARHGFREDYGDFSFVRCADGWFYWIGGERSTTAVKRARPGLPAVTFVHLGNMRPGWLGITSTCDLLFASRGVVHRISPRGKISALHSRALGEVMGVWADQGGNVYAALPEQRRVVRIASDGAVSTAATTSPPWRPSSGLVTPGGALWLLEFDSANRQRARRHSWKRVAEAGRR